MVDLAELEDTLKTSIAKALNDINKIESKDLSQREKFINTINNHIDEIKDNLELYDYTCLDYTKRPEFPQYKKKYAELKKQYEEVKNTFEKKKNPELAGRLSGETNPDYIDPKSSK
jgi:predicted ribonuclease toxin of YeeF-YezG toxin-antitoxin module